MPVEKVLDATSDFFMWFGCEHLFNLQPSMVSYQPSEGWGTMGAILNWFKQNFNFCLMLRVAGIFLSHCMYHDQATEPMDHQLIHIRSRKFRQVCKYRKNKILSHLIKFRSWYNMQLQKQNISKNCFNWFNEGRNFCKSPIQWPG